MSDTITAISTALGEAAIGIIRISGPAALEIGQKIFKDKFNNTFSDETERRLTYGHIVDEDEQRIDEVMAVYLKGPYTYTTEDMIEINCHGGMVPLKRILTRIISLGGRMAEPGEFTKLAFLNGRMDLSQAEAVMDLISAKTGAGFDIAYQQLEGKLSQKITSLRNKLLNLIAQIEVSIDYPEEDIEDITYGEIENGLEDIINHLVKLLKGSEQGKILREGLKTVIVGRPNVGKSSLMNALLQESRAIVTEIPGTTRDLIEESINIRGIPLNIVDTAGIRTTEDLVEKIGVERSKELFNRADLIILVLNAAESLTDDDLEILSLIQDKHAIIMVNKTDLPGQIDYDFLKEHYGNVPLVRTSIANEHGLDELEDHIETLVYGEKFKKQSESGVLANVRHITSLTSALESAREALRGVKERMPYDFIEVDMKNIFDRLGEVTGDTVESDLLGQIFSNFCIGK